MQKTGIAIRLWITLLTIIAAAAIAPPAGAQHPGGAGGHPAAAMPTAAESAAADAATAALALDTAEARLRAHVAFLASEECGGRRTGTEGADLAADYLAAALEQLGYAPAPEKRSYKQGFSVTRGIQLAAEPRLSIAGRELSFGVDYAVAGFSGSGSVGEAPLLFAGYGIVAPELDWNDYEGLEAEGSAVVVIRGEPQEDDPESAFSGTQPSVYSDLRRKATTARDLGAAVLLVVSNPLSEPDDELPEMRPIYSAANLDLPVVFVRREQLINALIGGTGLSWHEIVETMDLEGRPLPAPLPATLVSAEISVEKELATGYNIVGMLAGGDPELAGQYVVLGAHYDHLGIGGPESTTPERYGEIHFGADDNASGVAAVLETARWAAEHRERLGRGVLVCLFSGEEMGLLGSRALIEHPPLPAEALHSMLNLDMIGHLKDDTLIVGASESAAEFAGLLEAPAAAQQLRLSIDQSGLGGSDHMNYVRAGIPSLFFCTGGFVGYHSPDDTPDQINYDGLGRITGLCEGLLADLAVWPEPLTFNPEASAVPMAGKGRGGLSVTMGTVPEFGELPVPGMGVADLVPGGPAEAAGFLPGDVIVKILDRKVASIQDFMFVLQDCEPNQTVPVTIWRDGEELVFDVTLQARGVRQ